MMSVKNMELFIEKRLEKIPHNATEEKAVEVLESIYNDLEKEGADSHTIKTIIDNEIIKKIKRLAESALGKRE